MNVFTGIYSEDLRKTTISLSIAGVRGGILSQGPPEVATRLPLFPPVAIGLPMRDTV